MPWGFGKNMRGGGERGGSGVCAEPAGACPCWRAHSRAGGGFPPAKKEKKIKEKYFFKKNIAFF
jgi:hypothetical protein